MDTLLKMFNDTVVEIQGFNDSHFRIFKEEDRKDLTHMWYHEAGQNPNKFISMLSPEQKDYVSFWALRKNNTSIDEIIQHLFYALKEFQSLAEKYKKHQPKALKPDAPPPPYSLEPLIPTPPPNFKDLTKVCPKLYPSINQFDDQAVPTLSSFMDAKKPKGYSKDMKKIEALGDKYNLTFSKKEQAPLRTRDISRARLKSSLQSFKSIVLV